MIGTWAGDWIAGYAAVVATAAFAWQAVTYWSAHRPKLALTFEPGIIVVNEDGADALIALRDGRTTIETGLEWFFDLRVTNRGRARVQLNGLRLTQTQVASRQGRGWDGGRRAGLPIWLEPGEERSFRFTDDDLEDASMTTPFKVTVSPDFRSM
jgi:hypothetical protein